MRDELDTRSYWTDTESIPGYPALDRDLDVDAVVVGAGLTGLTAAYLLQRSGRRVAVLERMRVGGVDSMATTAHVTCVTDLDGRERVLGFHFPGEVIGLDGIDGERYPCDAVALDTVALCRFSFPRMADLAMRLPLLQQHLFRLLSRDIHTATRLGGDWSADTRIAAFLVDIGRRLASRGFSARRFELTMARTDIANYLRLAPETVSRVLRRFQESNFVNVDRREIELLDIKRLESLAAPALAT